jgi:ABC-type uncharacterized transport system substrate-binding protein
VLLTVRGIPAFDEATKGFLSEAPHAVVVTLDPQLRDARSVLEEVQRLQPAAVVALGSTAALAADEYLPGLPQVFGLVLNPQRIGASRADRTGFSLAIDPSTRIEALSRLFTPLRKLVIVHGPDGVDEVNALLAAAGARGTVAVTASVRSSQQLLNALKSVPSDAQALLLATEPLFLKEEVAEALLIKAFEMRIPVIGFSEKTVRMGGLAALEIDYERHGAELARTAESLRIGQAGAHAGGVRTSREYRWSVNPQTAHTLGLTIPAEILASDGSPGETR